MRIHDTLTRVMIAASALFVLSCQRLELRDTQEHKIVASVGTGNTKANFHLTETPNVLCEWNGRETLRVYYKKSDGKYHSLFANAPVAKIEEGGKSAAFTYYPEPEWGLDGADNSYPVAIFSVNCFPTIDPEDGAIYLDARLIRQPLKDFELPVYYVGEVVNGSVEATFSHYYAYEFLHVKNMSDKTIDFSLNGYETPWIWYKKLASVGLEDGVVYNKSWSGLNPTEESYPISIDPGSSDIIVSAYIPNDFIIKDASIVATIDGNIVKSTNKKSSSAPLSPGRAYHMYATWDGNELKFDKANELPDELGIGFTHLDMQEDGGYGFVTGREGYLRLESSDPSVATVSETDEIGEMHVEIFARSIGTAIITITDTNTGQKSQIEVVVIERTEFGAAVSVGETEAVTMKNKNGSFEAYSDDTSIATCKVVGNVVYVTGIGNGETTIHVTDRDTNKEYSISVFVYGDGTQDIVPEAVDLGLSVKWASFNLGATRPEEYGDYYAWGETEPKDDYRWETYKWGNCWDGPVTKYCNDSKLAADGFTDRKTVLDSEDDAAQVNLGGKWRMPTSEELDELVDRCNWTWTTENGVTGYRVTSKEAGYTDKYIFLPAAGIRYNTTSDSSGEMGFYFSSSLNVSMSSANTIHFKSSYVEMSSESRYFGGPVRPVYDDSNSPEIEVTPTDINFGAVPYGSSSTKYVTVKNIGRGVLSFTVENVSAPFSALLSGGSLSSGASLQLAFTYTPLSATSGAGERCTIVSNATKSVVSVNFSGSGTVPGVSTPDAVDMGLSVKWASFNLGATKPEEYGDYYAWGETEPKSAYAWSTYKWCNGSDRSLTKYNVERYFGNVDNKRTLDPEDDAAQVKLGGKWRMPTWTEQYELRDSCDWTWTTLNGVKGYKVVSRTNGNSIFLPAAGALNGSSFLYEGSDGRYWSSFLYTSYSSAACELGFETSIHGWNVGFSSRYNGQTIRPVCE